MNHRQEPSPEPLSGSAPDAEAARTADTDDLSLAESNRAEMDVAFAHAETVSFEGSSDADAERSKFPQADDTVETAATLPQLENFEVLGRLGRGGMGVVYQARDRALNRMVAVKVLRAGTDAEEAEIARFRKEARVIAQLQHPHVVQVFEVGEADGMQFIVLELMNGGSLADYLDGTPLPAKTAADVIATLADGAEAAHQLGVIHRDLKPGNVLVSLPDRMAAVEPHRPAPRDLTEPDVVLKLADFGLAKSMSVDDGFTMTGMIVGTPRYAAPEQLEGDSPSLSPATDVYALGAILYELTTGVPVFRTADVLELIDAVRKREPIAPRLLNASLARDLETICLKCLQKSPADRYPSARGLADDLRRFAGGEPILARPVGRVERGLKWLRRNPLAAALWSTSLVAALTLVALGVSMGYQGELSRTNSRLSTAQQQLTSQNEQLESQNDDLEQAKEVAVAAEREAARQRDEAQQARDLLARHRYANDMQLAGRAWREGDVARVRALLKRHEAGKNNLRGFEWYYLKGLDNSGLLSLPAWSGRFTPDGKTLAVGHANEVVLFDAMSMQRLWTMEGSSYGGARLAISGDGRRLLAAGFDGHFYAWTIADGRQLANFDQHKYWGNVAINLDGSLALTTGFSDDRTVKLWRVDDGEVLADWYAEGGRYAGGIAFSPDGKQFAVGWSPTGAVRVAAATEPEKFVEIPVGDPNEFYAGNEPAVRFGPRSERLFVSFAGRVGFIRLENLSPKSTLEATPITGSLLELHPSGQFLLTSVIEDHSLRLWDVESGTLLCRRKGHVGDFEFFFRFRPACAASRPGRIRRCGCGI